MTAVGIIGGVPRFTINFLEVYVSTQQNISATDGSAQTIIYGTVVTSCSAVSINTSTGLITLNYPGKYLFNMKARFNTGSAFSPSVNIYFRINGLSQGFVGNHWDVYANGACNSNQTTAACRQIIQVPTAGQTCEQVIILPSLYGSGTFPSVPTLAQGSRSTITYLGQ